MKKLNRPQKSVFGETAIGVWENEIFGAAAFEDGNSVRLSICKKDLSDGIGWDELQAVKNACGFADKDAVEFYPAQEDVLNTGNFRHLYIFSEKLPLIRRAKNHAS